MGQERAALNKLTMRSPANPSRLSRPVGRREGNRLTDIWRRDADERGSVGKMFPKNGSGVDAAGDCGAWELDERATKHSGPAERGWVYKGPDAGGHNGNSG